MNLAGRGLFLLLFCCSCQELWARSLEAPAAAQDYRLRAEFLYHFAKLVQWPTNTFPSADSALTIGVLGRDPFGMLLDDLVSNKKIDGHSVRTKRFASVDDVRGCHVLYISVSEDRRMARNFAGLAGKPILTVGESSEFLDHGGIIRFVVEDRRLRFQIRLSAAERNQLKLSSKLLFLCKPLYRQPVSGGIPPPP